MGSPRINYIVGKHAHAGMAKKIMSRIIEAPMNIEIQWSQCSKFDIDLIDLLSACRDLIQAYRCANDQEFPSLSRTCFVTSFYCLD